MESRFVKYGDRCYSANQCEHHSLACTFNNTKIKLSQVDVNRYPHFCTCPSKEFTFDRHLRRCRRYSFGDRCEGYCGDDSDVYKTGLTCSNRKICICKHYMEHVTAITVPAVRSGVVALNDGNLELFDNIHVCIPKESIAELLPGSPCDVKRMTGLCEINSLCLSCVDGSPTPICRMSTIVFVLYFSI